MKPLTFFTAAALSLTLALPAMAACTDPAAPGVDWSGCNKATTDLGYVNLCHADLINTDLRQANLTHADLSNADLSHADLSHANLSHADLHGARLDRTKWTDGRRCAVGSTGVCY